MGLSNNSGSGAVVAGVISRICGWAYFVLWGASCYPQSIKNFRRKSTVGVSFDYSILNLMGMFAYSINTVSLFASPTIIEQYGQRHEGHFPSVRANDVAYAVHGLVLCIFTFSQFYKSVWGLDADPNLRMSKGVKCMVIGSAVTILAAFGFVACFGKNHGFDASGLAWIDFINTVGYVKLMVTSVKYIPQLYENYRRKSTRGWSIVQMEFDISGSTLSLMQLLIDAAIENSWSGVTGNPTKLFLAAISLVFDSMFFVQHFILYRAERLEHERAQLVDEETISKSRPADMEEITVENKLVVSEHRGTEREPLLPRSHSYRSYNG